MIIAVVKFFLLHIFRKIGSETICRLISSSQIVYVGFDNLF
jgi:hypothetical protein